MDSLHESITGASNTEDTGTITAWLRSAVEGVVVAGRLRGIAQHAGTDGGSWSEGLRGRDKKVSTYMILRSSVHCEGYTG